MITLFAADAILVAHSLFVAFVVFGLILILIGGAMKWSWVRNFRFRILHLVAIGIVVLQSWLGMICPLTTWEMDLRTQAGDTVYTGSFVSFWIRELLFYEAPAWVFVACYSVFGALVVASWFWILPKRKNNSPSGNY
ncbi:MAG: DUF2784 domain-containing protein [Gammaproteobacteria bacterium]|nr:DUF2784 domain-containing protein [Gammaproteobacteria bacterium]